MREQERKERVRRGGGDRDTLRRGWRSPRERDLAGEGDLDRTRFVRQSQA